MAPRQTGPRFGRGHVLPPGLGKTAFASLILTEAGHSKRLYAGQSSAEITADIYSLDGGEFLFVDEVHSLQAAAVEVVQLAMEGGVIAGKYADPVPPWTLVGATTKLGKIPAPIRDRFGLTLHLNYYENEDITKIAIRSGEKLNMEVRPESGDEIAIRSRGVPRIANRLLRRVRDVYDSPTPQQVDEILVELGVDSWGFEICDRALLMLLQERFKGGPVGLRTLAAAYGLEERTLAEVYEPYMVRTGVLDITDRGRQLGVNGWIYCKQIAARLGLRS
jgi:Holliday junction DNA helicase RuvB